MSKERISISEFSLVCPVYNEFDLIPVSLPSFYSVNPSEVVLCFDDPLPSKETYDLCQKISSYYNHIPTRFLLVKRNPEYKANLAWVRHVGFTQAKYDRILVVDADLVINKKVLKTVELVGKNNIGLVSCSRKYPYPHNGIKKVWVAITQKIINLVYPMRFTGLYAIWRPYWLDSEDEGIKNLKVHSSSSSEMKAADTFGELSYGDDVYLRNSLIRKHRAIYLRDIGASCLRANPLDKPSYQFQIGRYFASKNYSIFQILLRSILYLRFYVILGWLYEKRRILLYGVKK